MYGNPFLSKLLIRVAVGCVEINKIYDLNSSYCRSIATAI